ncbi:MAG: hypothetical protein AB8H79_26025 [Myxococcota bacterium]
MTAADNTLYNNLTVAVSTWLLAVRSAGHELADAQVAKACDAIRSATDATTGDAAGQALVDLVEERLAGEEPAAVRQALLAVLGDVALIDLGAGERDDRIHRIRSYHFSHGLPWLCRIYERKASGAVQPGWVLVERVSDRVQIMDPNPWDDIDEDRVLPVGDFQVLWELDGCPSIALD